MPPHQLPCVEHATANAVAPVLSNIDVTKADSYKPADKTAILEAVSRLPGGARQINHDIAHKIRELISQIAERALQARD